MSVAVAEPFTPACMEPDELAAWMEMRNRSTSQFDRSASPCTDCRLAFAIEMRAAGTCNGSPHGVEEDEDMDLSKIPNVQAEPTRSVTLDVMPPPCASCAHESVCSLRTAVETMSTHKMAAPSLPDGLRLTLVAGVECDHFLRDRAKPAPARVLTSQERGQGAMQATRKPQTAEHRAHIREGQERARERAAALKAATS